MRPRVAETIAENLTTPWGLVFLPDGGALLSERDTGAIKRVEPSGRLSEVGTVPGVVPPEETSEGGLLGITLHEGELYAYYTAESDNRVAKLRYSRIGLGSPEVILDGIPQGAYHNGGRMIFGPDDYLYVATGEGGDTSLSQDRSSLGGKILRVTTDGEPAPGNPFDDSPVWSLGHRNVQGLVFDDDGRLWASEFGQDTWDEVNLIRPGRNYGWPEAEGMGEEGSDFENPHAVWSTDEASPSGLTYADGALWMASLMGERLWRIQLDGARVDGEPKAFLTGRYGRLRTVEAAPDGSLWLTTSNTDGRGDPADNDDRILRLDLVS